MLIFRANPKKLDNPSSSAYNIGVTYSIQEAAQLIDVDPQTLFRWLWAGKVKASIVVDLGKTRKLSRFTPQDIRKLRRYVTDFYGQGRGGPGKKRSKARPKRKR